MHVLVQVGQSTGAIPYFPFYSRSASVSAFHSGLGEGKGLGFWGLGFSMAKRKPSGLELRGSIQRQANSFASEVLKPRLHADASPSMA